MCPAGRRRAYDHPQTGESTPAKLRRAPAPAAHLDPVQTELSKLQTTAGNRATEQLLHSVHPARPIQRMPESNCTTLVAGQLETAKPKATQFQRQRQGFIRAYYDEAKADLPRMRTLTKPGEAGRLATIEKMANELLVAKKALDTKKWDDLVASLDKIFAIYGEWRGGEREEEVVETELDPDGNDRGMWGAGGAWVFTPGGAADLAAEHGYARNDNLSDHSANSGGHKLGHNAVYVKGAVGISPDDRGDAGNWTWKEFKISGSEARYIGTLRYTGGGNFVFLKRGGGGKSGASYSAFPEGS